MRTLYTVLFYALIPFILGRLFWRSFKAPEYRKRWGERFGFYKSISTGDVIWFHAVSVGEVEAIFPLIRRYQKELPHFKILITTTTPTGSARVHSVLHDSVEHVYLPYDIPFALNRFFTAFKPSIGVIVETEIWPNLYRYCGINHIPLYLINARLSEKSAKRYELIPSLVHTALSNLTLVIAQTEEDAQRFAALGVDSNRLATYGNIKFDIEIPSTLIEEGLKIKASEFQGRFIWVAGSTHDDEERLCLDIYRALKPSIPELLLVIAPRHPERFGHVFALCEKNNLRVVRRSARNGCNARTDVYLADTMGELKLLYAASDLAFVGGSLVQVGGHNILEALAVDVPVLFGPYMFNFKEIARKVTEADAAMCCRDQDALAEAVIHLYRAPDKRHHLINNGKLFLQANIGATARVFQRLSNAFLPHHSSE